MYNIMIPYLWHLLLLVVRWRGWQLVGLAPAGQQPAPSMAFASSTASLFSGWEGTVLVWGVSSFSFINRGHSLDFPCHFSKVFLTILG